MNAGAPVEYKGYLIHPVVRQAPGKGWMAEVELEAKDAKGAGSKKTLKDPYGKPWKTQEEALKRCQKMAEYYIDLGLIRYL